MKDIVYQFINQQKLGVVATIGQINEPQAALVGIAVSKSLEIIFDTVRASRKYKNILQSPKIAIVIGWEEEITVQYEGLAEVLGEDSLADNLKEVYYQTYPEGRERANTWPGLVHIKVTPHWIRFSKFNEPAVITEIIF